MNEYAKNKKLNQFLNLNLGQIFRNLDSIKSHISFQIIILWEILQWQSFYLLFFHQQYEKTSWVDFEIQNLILGSVFKADEKWYASIVVVSLKRHYYQ